MSTIEEGIEGEKALARAEEETGITRDEQITALQQIEVFKEGLVFAQDMGRRVMDLKNEQEKTKRHLVSAELADRISRRDFKLANKQLNLLEKTLTYHFAERKSQIEGGFRMIDKALEEGKWDEATKVFGDMSAMVSRSPLAAAIALNDKMKSGTITLDDF